MMSEDESDVMHALHRQMTAIKQMQEKAGPYYDLARERSRLINAAWRAMGSPRRVSAVVDNGEVSFVVRTKAGSVPATPEQREAWIAWAHQRRRIYEELGWANKLHQRDRFRRPIQMEEGEDE